MQSNVNYFSEIRIKKDVIEKMLDVKNTFTYAETELNDESLNYIIDIARPA